MTNKLKHFIHTFAATFVAAKPMAALADMPPPGSYRKSDNPSYQVSPELLPLYQNYSFPIAWGATMVSELMVAGIVLIFLKQLRHTSLMYSILAVNVISVPLLWFALSIFPRTTNILVLFELVIVAFEAAFIYFTNRAFLSVKYAFVLALLMNATSLLLGLATN